VSTAQENIERAIADTDRPEDAAAEKPLEPDLHPDRTRQMTHTSFSRMRINWLGDDSVRLQEILAAADSMIKDEFKVAFSVIERLHRHVRTPKLDMETGEIMYYPDQTPMWEADELGAPVEDWGLLDDRTRDSLLFTITTWLFEWELLAADEWAKAMFSKVQWEERFAKGFISLPGMQISGKPTIDDRTQWGHQFSAEERYFAVFRSVLSRKADALVRSMERLRRMLESTAIR
jgi:hypothetical protein